MNRHKAAEILSTATKTNCQKNIMSPFFEFSAFVCVV